MKKALFLVLVMGLILGSSMVALAQMHGMMHSEEKGMMMGNHMNMPMMSGMNMGMTRMIATADGGIIVISMGKLYKYDNDLNLKKEIDIPMDFEHMKKMQMKMKDMGMMGRMQESEPTESQSEYGHEAHH